MNKVKYCAAVWIVLLLFILSGCDLKTSVQEKNSIAPFEKLVFPDEDYSLLLWYPDRGLVAIKNNPRHTPEQQIMYAYEGDTKLKSLSLIADPTCPLRSVYFPMAQLPDHRLGLIEQCKKGVTDPRLDTEYLLAYDWQAETTKQIVAGDLPGKVAKVFSWNPEMTLGVQEMYSGLNGTLFWIDANGAKPMTVTLSDGQKSWSLDETYRDLLENSDDAGGIAMSPAWSPDGETIAFFASFDPIGKNDVSRWNSKYSLFLLNPATMSYRIVLRNLSELDTPFWSPDSQWIAFSGVAGAAKNRGLWLFSLRDNTLLFIAKGYFSSIVWSPDGKSIAVIYCSDGMSCTKKQILKYDLSIVR